MKENFRKLVISVFVISMVMFMAMATASADPRKSQLLRGKYSFTGSGNCVASATGFDDKFQPNGGASPVGALMQIWEGEYTFDGKGSGSIKATFRGVDLLPLTYKISIADVSWKFKYEMTDHNRFITYLPDEPGYYDTVEDPAKISPSNYFNIVGKCDGAVERDGASIKITCAPPQKHIMCIPDGFGYCVNLEDLGGPPVELLCSESHVGLRVHE
jgi:hypothetical protein